MASQCLPEALAIETRGRRRSLHPSEVLLKKRTLVESVIKALKTRTVLEHSRHRSFENFQVNVASALIAYQLSENKPALNFDELQEISDLPVLFCGN